MAVKSTRHRILTLFIPLALLLFLTIDFFVLSAISRIIIQGHLPDQCSFKIYGINKSVYLFHGLSGFHEQQSFVASPRPDAPHSYATHTGNSPLYRIRIDVENCAEDFSLHGITFTSFFGSPDHWNAATLQDSVALLHGISSYKRSGENVLFKVSGDDPYVIFNSSVHIENIFLRYLFPVILAAVLTVLLSQVNWHDIPAFHDISHRQTSTNISYRPLDGIRGIAAILVLLEHSVGMLGGIGRLGVLFFFCLSGFLLATPFVKNPALCTSFPYISTYFSRRIRRIVPLYFCVILAFYIFKQRDVATFLRHLLFLQGDAHLWTIPQEMFFYFSLPVILFILSTLFRYGTILVAAALFLLALLFDTFVTADMVPMYGMGTKLAPLTGIFLLGVVSSCFYYMILPKHRGLHTVISQQEKIINVFGIFLLLLLVYFSCSDVWRISTAQIVKKYQFMLAIGCCLLLMIPIVTRHSLLARIFSATPLCAVGIVGYSFYLLHPTVIFATKKLAILLYGTPLPGIMTALIAGMLTYSLSILSYSFIEKPFMRH